MGFGWSKSGKNFIPLSRELLTSSQWKSLSLVWLFVTLWNSPWNSPGQNTGVGSHSFLQAVAKWLQSCPTLCNPIDSSPPGSPVPRILQARILEWVAISFSNASKWKVKVKSFSCVLLLETPWTIAYQAPPSMGFSRQEHWSGLPLSSPLPSPRIFSTQGSNPGLPHCRRILYQLSHQGSPKILEWVAYPFSRGSSRPRNQTRVSCIAGRFFTSWATGDVP